MDYYRGTLTACMTLDMRRGTYPDARDIQGAEVFIALDGNKDLLQDIDDRLRSGYNCTKVSGNAVTRPGFIATLPPGCHKLRIQVHLLTESSTDKISSSLPIMVDESILILACPISSPGEETIGILREKVRDFIRAQEGRWSCIFLQPFSEIAQTGHHLGRFIWNILSSRQQGSGLQISCMTSLPADSEFLETLNDCHQLTLWKYLLGKGVIDPIPTEIWHRWEKETRHPQGVLLWLNLREKLTEYTTCNFQAHFDPVQRTFAAIKTWDQQSHTRIASIRDRLQALIDWLQQLLSQTVGTPSVQEIPPEEAESRTDAPPQKPMNRIWQDFCVDVFFRPILEKGVLPETEPYLFTSDALAILRGNEIHRADLSHLMARTLSDALFRQGIPEEREVEWFRKEFRECMLEHIDALHRIHDALKNPPALPSSGTWLEKIFSSQNKSQERPAWLDGLERSFRNISQNLANEWNTKYPDLILLLARQHNHHVGALGFEDRYMTGHEEQVEKKETELYPLMSELFYFESRIRTETKKAAERRAHEWSEVASPFGYSVIDRNTGVARRPPMIADWEQIDTLWNLPELQAEALWQKNLDFWLADKLPDQAQSQRDRRFGQFFEEFRRTFEILYQRYLAVFGAPQKVADQKFIEDLHDVFSVDLAIDLQRKLFHPLIGVSEGHVGNRLAGIHMKGDTAREQKTEKNFYVLSQVQGSFDTLIGANFHFPQDVFTLCWELGSWFQEITSFRNADHWFQSLPAKPDVEKS